MSGDFSEHVPPADSEEDEGRRGPPQRDRVIAAILAHGVNLWRDADGSAYATIQIGGTLQRHAVRSRAFRDAVRFIYGQANIREINGTLVPSAISDTGWKEALPQIEAMASVAPTREPAIRTCQVGECIVIDIGDETWRAIEVSPGGWRIIDQTDIPLIRSNGMRALPIPARSASALADFRRLANLRGERETMLAMGWCVAALWPNGPYAILSISGESESGKTSICRFIRSFIDPNLADLRKPPKDQNDIAIAGANARVIAYENLSSLSAEMADDLCRIATGAGFAKRSLYTNGEEHLAYVCRPVLLNGIPALMTRGDLASRTLDVMCPPIPANCRLTEEEYAAACDAARPGILALILDGLAMALRDVPSLKLANPPRLGLAAKIAIAAAPAFGWSREEMREAIDENRTAAAAAAIDADQVGCAIRDGIMGTATAWHGTAQSLLSALVDLVPPEARDRRSWPADATRLSARLRRLAPAMRLVGIDIETGERTKRARTLHINRKVAETASPASPASSKRKNGGFPPVSEVSRGDAENPASVTQRHPASPQRHPLDHSNTLNNHEMRSGGDAGDAGDAIPGTLGVCMTSEHGDVI